MLDWIIENWETVFAVIGVISTACSAIVKAFSGCSWMSVIVNICEKASIFNTKENLEKIEAYNNKKKASKK